MIEEYFYEKTGMYIDLDQLCKLPEIDTLVDVGVGDTGTPELYDRYPEKHLILIDPLIEAQSYAINNLGKRNYEFHLTALGSEKGKKVINIESDIGRSTILKTTSINDEGKLISQRTIEINTLDEVLRRKDSLGKIGIKIDTEGYELDVIRGASDTLFWSKFLIAEVDITMNHSPVVINCISLWRL